MIPCRSCSCPARQVRHRKMTCASLPLAADENAQARSWSACGGLPVTSDALPVSVTQKRFPGFSERNTSAASASPDMVAMSKYRSSHATSTTFASSW